MAKHSGEIPVFLNMKPLAKSSNRRKASAWTLLARKCRFQPAVMAKEADMSVGHLRRLCRDVFGESIGAWIRRERMVAARQVIAESRSTKVTMDILGYRYRSQFARDFQAAYGVSPTAWLRKTLSRQAEPESKAAQAPSAEKSAKCSE